MRTLPITLPNRAHIIAKQTAIPLEIKYLNYKEKLIIDCKYLIKKNTNHCKTIKNNLKVFILPRVAELFIHKKKQRGCPLLGANRYTHIYISYICVYILFICLRL